MDISHHLRWQIKHLPTARTKDTSPGGSPLGVPKTHRTCSLKYQFKFLMSNSSVIEEREREREMKQESFSVFHNFYCSFCFVFLFVFFFCFDSISITNNVKCTIIKYIFIFIYMVCQQFFFVGFVFFFLYSLGLTLLVHTTRQLLKNCYDFDIILFTIIHLTLILIRLRFYLQHKYFFHFFIFIVI